MGNLTVQYPITGSYNSQISSKIDSQRTVNMYLINDNEGKSNSVNQDMAGIIEILRVGTDTTQSCRLLFTHRDFLYTIYGNQVYRINSDLILTSIGNPLSTDSGTVQYSTNENEIIFIDGIDGYLWNFTTNTATFPIPRTTTNSGFPFQPIDVTSIDGYFVVEEGQSNNWFWSGLNDGLEFDPTNFLKILSKPDQCVALATVNRRMFLFGSVITEQWYNDPVSNSQPFQRDNNMIFEYGCHAIGSLIENFGIIVWLASTKDGVESIRTTDGGPPVVISSPEIDHEFKEYEKSFDLTDAVSMLYKENGHMFYEISFSNANKTWVYDFNTRAWFERSMNNGDRFVGQHYASYFGVNRVGSSKDNRLFNLSSSIGIYDDQNFIRERISPPFSSKNLNSFRVNKIEIDMVTGIASSNGLNSEPEVFMSISRDGGVTFGNEIKASVGKIGQRKYKVNFFRLGTQDDFITKIRYYNNVPTTLLGASINYDEFNR